MNRADYYASRESEDTSYEALQVAHASPALCLTRPPNRARRDYEERAVAIPMMVGKVARATVTAADRYYAAEARDYGPAIVFVDEHNHIVQVPPSHSADHDDEPSALLHRLRRERRTIPGAR